MLEHSVPQNRLVLEDSRDGGKLEVSMEGFFELSFYIAEGLEDLMALHRQKEAMRMIERVRSRPAATTRFSHR